MLIQKAMEQAWHAAVCWDAKVLVFPLFTGYHLSSAILAILSLEPPLLLVHRLNLRRSKWWEAGNYHLPSDFAALLAGRPACDSSACSKPDG